MTHSNEQQPLPVRPVRCWYCSQPMHYAGHAQHEPEVRLTLESGPTEEVMYLHTRCWNEWQQRKGAAT